MRRRRPSYGATLVELLVVTGIIAVLAGLLLPAINAAREAASAARCKTRLRQLASAVHQYEGVHGMIPGPMQVGAPDYWANHNNFLSIPAALLPYLDQSAIWESLNTVTRIPIDYETSFDTLAPQATAMEKRIAVFLCPNDRTLNWGTGVSYRANFGVSPHWVRIANFPEAQMGFFDTPGYFGYSYPLSKVVDGLSKTAMFSERPPGRPIIADSDLFPHSRYTTDDAAAECQRATALRDVMGSFVNTGRYWLLTGQHQTLYTHILPPNSGVDDCGSFLFLPPKGAVAARSNHPGGVHVALGDGAVQFVSNNVALSIWRSLGTRNGDDDVNGL